MDNDYIGGADGLEADGYNVHAESCLLQRSPSRYAVYTMKMEGFKVGELRTDFSDTLMARDYKDPPLLIMIGLDDVDSE